MNKTFEMDAGFRLIHYTYMDSMDPDELDLKLRDDYIALHTYTQSFINQVNSFEKDFSELQEMLKTAGELFEKQKILREELTEFHNMKVAAGDTVQMGIITAKVDNYNLRNRELIDVVRQMDEKCRFVYDLDGQISEKDERFDEQFENFRDLMHELYQDYQNHATDIVTFDKDEQDFLGVLGPESSRWNNVHNSFCAFMDGYNQYITDLTAFIEITEKNNVIEPILITLPEEQEISPEQKNGRKLYIRENHPDIERLSGFLNDSASTGDGVHLQLDFNEIKEGIIKPVTDIIKVSQHKNKWIRNLIFNLRFYISNIPQEENETNKNLLLNPNILLFLEKLGKNPIIYFFLKNRDAAMTCLTADILLDPDTEIKKVYDVEYDDNFMMQIGFNAEQVQIIFDRFFQGCVAFYQYCYKTGIDTKPYIESSIQTMMDGFGLNEHHVKMTYEDVVEHSNKLESLPFKLYSN